MDSEATTAWQAVTRPVAQVYATALLRLPLLKMVLPMTTLLQAMVQYENIVATLDN